MNPLQKHVQIALLLVAAMVFASSIAQADVVTDWNAKASEIIVGARLAPPPAYWVLAIVQSAVYETVNAITGRYPAERLKLTEVGMAMGKQIGELAVAKYLRPLL